MGRTKERDTSIEFIRVIACFLVVVHHIRIAPIAENGIFFEGRSLQYTITRWCIPLFLLITGFLSFQQKNVECKDKLWATYVHKLWNFLLYVFLPSVITVIVSAVFYGAIVEGKTLSEVFTEKNFQWIYLKDYLLEQSADYICVDLWYIWTYAKIVFLYPVLAFLCQDSKNENRIRRFYMLCSFGNLLCTDIGEIIGKTALGVTTSFFDQYLLQVLLGYEIYLFFQKKEQAQKIGVFVGSILILLGVGGQIALEKLHFLRYGTVGTVQTTLMVGGVGCFMVLYGIKQRHNLDGAYLWIGKKTLYIYLVHVSVIFCFRNIWEDFFWNLCGAGKNMISLVAYDILYGLVIFGISLLIGMMFEQIYEKLILRVGKKLLGIVVRVEL